MVGRLEGMAFEETPAERREVTVRRAPKYVPFLILGALVLFDIQVVALLLDRRSIKRQKRAIVEAVPDSEPDDGA